MPERCPSITFEARELPENTAPAAHHRCPSVFKFSSSVSARKTSAGLNKAVFFLQGKEEDELSVVKMSQKLRTL